MELVKPESEHREPIIVGYFILQNAKLIMFELYYTFFKNFYDTDKYEELEMDTDLLHLTLSKENLEDVILPKKCDQLRSKDCTDDFTANTNDNFSPELAVRPTRKMIRGSQDYLKESLDVQKRCACVAKPIVATIERVTSTNSVAMDSLKEL